MKLELKHITEHATNGGRLRCLDDDNYWFDDKIKSINYQNKTVTTTEGMSLELSDFSTIAFMVKRPMSDLAKEIEENGERFVPIVEIKKDLNYYYVDVNFDGNILIKRKNENYTWCNEIFDVYQKLFEWHFNVYNLPEELFVDINTLK